MTTLNSIAGGLVEQARPGQEHGWPAGAQLTVDDILVNGQSLAAAATPIGRTPLVRIGESPSADSRRTGIQEFATIIVTRVEHVDRMGLLQRADVWIDAAIAGCRPNASTMRVIGRRSATHTRKFRLLSELDPGSHRDVRLPADLHDGDILAMLCSGTVALSTVRAHPDRSHSVWPIVEDDSDDLPYTHACGR